MSSYEYKTVRTPIDDLTALDELLATLIQQMDYRMVRAANPNRDGNRFKYQSKSRDYTINGGEFVEIAGYLNPAKAFNWMIENNIDLNHDGGTPRMWMASMICPKKSKHHGIYLQSTDLDPHKAVFKVYLKSQSTDLCMDLPL